MPKARKAQVSLVDTCYYHCMSRCVRRSFLCGDDPYTGKSYEHRRQWVADRLLQLTGVFSINIAAFAVMSNHTHVVLCVEQEQAKALSVLEILERWHQLFCGTLLTQRYCKANEREQMSSAEVHTVEKLAETYRTRLIDISWFMRTLNEYIARQANKEDGCRGRFWEGRFKSQALLDEQALLACMAYVDLNPIRSKMADTPETSDHTSIKLRVKAALLGEQPAKLKPFNTEQTSADALPCHLNDYLELIEFTGRTQREDKLGQIPANSGTLLERLDISLEHWLELTQGFEHQFCHIAGRVESLQACHQSDGMVRIRGSHNASRLFVA